MLKKNVYKLQHNIKNLIQNRKKVLIHNKPKMLEIGQQAPDFILVDQEGKEIKLSDFRGKNILLAFYPFDFSPVCTIEFGFFEQDLNKLNELNAQVLGISVDSKYCHKEFAQKLGLNFPLLSDFNREVCKLYGTLRKEGFSERAYFIIDKNSIVRFKYLMPTPKDKLENEQLIENLKTIYIGDLNGTKRKGDCKA